MGRLNFRGTISRVLDKVRLVLWRGGRSSIEWAQHCCGKFVAFKLRVLANRFSRIAYSGDQTMTGLIIAGAVVFVGLIGVAGRCVFCRDGWLSHSFGRRGACSWHGGVDRS
jgi:hypothetical protein